MDPLAVDSTRRGAEELALYDEIVARLPVSVLGEARHPSPTTGRAERDARLALLVARPGPLHDRGLGTSHAGAWRSPAELERRRRSPQKASVCSGSALAISSAARLSRRRYTGSICCRSRPRLWRLAALPSRRRRDRALRVGQGRRPTSRPGAAGASLAPSARTGLELPSAHEAPCASTLERWSVASQAERSIAGGPAAPYGPVRHSAGTRSRDALPPSRDLARLAIPAPRRSASGACGGDAGRARPCATHWRGVDLRRSASRCALTRRQVRSRRISATAWTSSDATRLCGPRPRRRAKEALVRAEHESAAQPPAGALERGRQRQSLLDGSAEIRCIPAEPHESSTDAAVEIEAGVPPQRFRTRVNLMTLPSSRSRAFSSKWRPTTRTRVVCGSDYRLLDRTSTLRHLKFPRTPARGRGEVDTTMCERFRSMPKAVIAEIGGRVGGGGSELALSCDMRFGARGRTVINQPEVALGILPGGSGTQRLPRLVGRGRALELILGCDDLDAESAELGLSESRASRTDAPCRKDRAGASPASQREIAAAKRAMLAPSRTGARVGRRGARLPGAAYAGRRREA